MTDEVEICNTALSFLGQTTITSLDDRTRTAQLCKQVYAPLRDSLLESKMWSFAAFKAVSETVQVVGRVDGATNTYAENGYPEWGNQFVHTIDDNFLSVFRVYSDVSGSVPVPAVWERMGDYIVSDSALVYMEGNRRETNPNKFSELFIQALSQRIAADLCIPITQNQKLFADMYTVYNDKMSIAAALDGQQGRNERIRPTRLKGSRNR
jgi:hypothetical protein